MTAAVAKLNLPSMRDRVSPAEWQQRVELAACYRLTHHFGWAAQLGTHLSARIPDEPEHFLLNPVGLLFDEITASSLVKVDMNGKKLSESPYRVNYAGVEIHGAAYEARPDVMSALHTHTKTGVAISMIEDGVVSLSQTSMRFHKRISYHDFAGPADAMDDRQRMGRDLGQNWAMIMRNHGLLVCGRNVGEAFVVMTALEGVIEAQLLAMSTGAKLTPLDDALCDAAALNRDGKNERNNADNWVTFMRLADRLDPSYRD
jgi:ribulose-5-phosphate 4-epimerase/fuculose-1-phosphate aldolase